MTKGSSFLGILPVCALSRAGTRQYPCHIPSAIKRRMPMPRKPGSRKTIPKAYWVRRVRSESGRQL